MGTTPNAANTSETKLTKITKLGDKLYEKTSVSYLKPMRKQIKALQKLMGEAGLLDKDYTFDEVVTGVALATNKAVEDHVKKFQDENLED